MPDFAKIRIELPKGCIRHALSINALDARSRELANETFIYVDGKQLLCTAFEAIYENGKDPVLRLTVAEECFEIVEADRRRSAPARLPGERKGIF